MMDWKSGKIASKKDAQYKRYIVERKDMNSITLKEFRELMDKFWKEFENS